MEVYDYIFDIGTGVIESLPGSGLGCRLCSSSCRTLPCIERSDRKGRVQDMLSNVGISVTSGAITTLGASLFMLFAKILFFMQFGIFMFGTIGFSLLYSLGMFTVILGLIGPQGDTGSLIPIYRDAKRLFTGQTKSDVTCANCQAKAFINNRPSN